MFIWGPRSGASGETWPDQRLGFTRLEHSDVFREEEPSGFSFVLDEPCL